MRWLCLLLVLTAEPSDVAPLGKNNFARPKTEAPPTSNDRDSRIRRKLERPAAQKENVPVTPPPAQTPPEAPPPPPAAAPVMPRREQPPTGPAAQGGLSAYFGAELKPGDYAGVITALADRLNRQTLSGMPPREEFTRYQTASKELRGDSRETKSLVERLYGNMVSYLEIESEYAAKRSDTLLRKMAKLVTDQIGVDPNAPPERGSEIVKIMEGNSQFPPSSIVFGLQLLPYRPVKLPPGHLLLAVPTEPQYVDEEHRARASFDFLSWPGPICRVDFEASRVGELLVEQSNDRTTYSVVQTIQSKEPGGVQGPLLLTKPVRARYLRVTGAGGTEPPMLRNVQVSALKGPLVADVPAAPEAPVLDASFKEAAYPRQAEVIGFVRLDGSRFADEPCEVRLCHTADALVIGVYARDTRMATTVATQNARDASLDSDEAFEIQFRTGRGEPLRFVVNPLGVQFDGRGNDASWNGEWKAATKNYSTGWAAELLIPYSTLGLQPKAAMNVQANFLRHRRNVDNEDSAWAVEGGRPAWGTLAFH